MPLPKDKRIYANQNEEIMRKWDYEKNNAEGIYPNELTEGSHKHANFICPDCGNKWKGEIRDAGRYNGCKVCMRKARSTSNFQTRLKKGKSLFETNPELEKEWDFKENEKIGLYPEKVMAGTPKEAHWICSLNHHYVAYISNRAKKHTGCTFCSGQEVLEGFNDLATTRPELLKEWDYEKNSKINLFPNKVMRGTHENAYWICPVGHEYVKEIKLRTSGQGCTECAKRLQTSFPEQAILFYLSKIFDKVENRYGNPEIDIYIPSLKFGIEYDGIYYHKKKTEKDNKKDKIISEKGIYLLRIKEVNKKEIEDDDRVIFCELDSNYDYLRIAIEKILDILNKKYNVNTKINVDIENDRITIEEQYINSLKENSIITVKPELSKEWDYEKNGKIKPEYISYGSSTKYFWKCVNGHSYPCEPKKRVSGQGCPICYNRKLLSGYNDVETMHPKLLKFWDYEKNEKLPSESICNYRTKYYWICEKGHSYKASIPVKLKNTKCTICSGKCVVDGINDLATKYPEIAAEWDYEKNGNLKPTEVAIKSNKKVWWKCASGHEWPRKISDRTRYNSKCPQCKKDDKKH